MAREKYVEVIIIVGLFNEFNRSAAGKFARITSRGRGRLRVVVKGLPLLVRRCLLKHWDRLQDL